ncbi:hypothetical protein KP509_39G053400 [Ceratopteris richardii]|uniref:Uncharacterized protein n=1 Tax=Ceratopteris richardii TaxID=49495 RepID=A0A8T2Q1B0_CERRI|nr:hypothetical protein KP509_39G053400 [Ceratopteris richardii]
MDALFSVQPPCCFSHQRFRRRDVFPYFPMHAYFHSKAFVQQSNSTVTYSAGGFKCISSKPPKTWSWSTSERRQVYTPCFSYKRAPGEPAERTISVPLLLYRSLLLVGIGLGIAHPAVAGAPVTSEVFVQQVVGKAARGTAENSATQTEKKVIGDSSISEKPSQALSVDNAQLDLDETFWKDFDLSRGSMFAILKNVLDSDPNDRDALECLAKILVDSDTPSHSLPVIEKLELLEPGEVEWRYLKGFAYDMIGEFKKAKEIYQEILKVEPYSSKAIQGLMMAMDELDEVDELADVVDQTVNRARDEDNITEARNIVMLIGQFFMMKGHLREALEIYEDMLKEDSKDFRPYLCEGMIYSTLGETAKAEQKFKMYEKLCPQDYPERKYLDALMRKAKREGLKQSEQKQKEKYIRIPKEVKGDEFPTWGSKGEKQAPSKN